MERPFKIKVIFLFLLSLIFLDSAFTKDKAIIWIHRVNGNPMVISALWEHKLLRPGSRGEMQTVALIELKKSGHKFHILVKKRGEEEEEWIFDGKNLYGINRLDKIIYIMPIKRKRSLYFWEIPIKMRPFGAPKIIGEGNWKGRKTIILQITGEYEKAPVTITYTVDKEKAVLLKKEHILGPLKEPLWKETFEVKLINFPSSLPQETFSPPSSPGFVEVKKRILTSEYLNTKF